MNNAGVGANRGWPTTIDINLSAVYHGMAIACPMMAASGGGAIVNTASIAGLNALVRPNKLADDPAMLESVSAYVGAKHGVVGITKQFAVAYASRGVRVNAICPGYIVTPMTAPAREREGGAEFLRVCIPPGGLGEPEEGRRLPRSWRVTRRPSSTEWRCRSTAVTRQDDVVKSSPSIVIGARLMASTITPEQVNKFVQGAFDGLSTLICEEISPTHAVTSFDTANVMLRPGGYIPGPTQFSSADGALWYLVFGALDRFEPMALTSELSIRYLRPAVGKTLYARADLDRLVEDSSWVPCAFGSMTIRPNHVLPRKALTCFPD